MVFIILLKKTNKTEIILVFDFWEFCTVLEKKILYTFWLAQSHVCIWIELHAIIIQKHCNSNNTGGYHRTQNYTNNFHITLHKDLYCYMVKDKELYLCMVIWKWFGVLKYLLYPNLVYTIFLFLHPYISFICILLLLFPLFFWMVEYFFTLQKYIILLNQYTNMKLMLSTVHTSKKNNLKFCYFWLLFDYLVIFILYINTCTYVHVYYLHVHVDIVTAFLVKLC